jgi:hypothetical protein
LPVTGIVAGNGPPAPAELLLERRIAAISIPVIDRRGARFTPPFLVPAVDDDFDSLADELPVEGPQQRAVIAGENHDHGCPSYGAVRNSVDTRRRNAETIAR